MGREECECDHRIDEPHEEGCAAAEDEEYGKGLAGSDVFIVGVHRSATGARRRGRSAGPTRPNGRADPEEPPRGGSSLVAPTLVGGHATVESSLDASLIATPA
jgi:hypothetical protein